MKVNLRFDDYLRTKVEGWAARVVEAIRVELHNQSIEASGNLSASLEYEADGDHVRILADGYFPYAEVGRRAGKVPYRFTDILEKWVKDKGVIRPASFRTDKAFASAIAYNIKHYGSSRYRGDRPKVDLVGPVLDKELPVLNQIVDNAVTFYINDALF